MGNVLLGVVGNALLGAVGNVLLVLLGVVGNVPELKGSIGEGPNHSNYSDRSSVRILSKFRNVR